MNPKILELINRPKFHTITMTYETYGRVMVSCIIKPIYHKRLAVIAYGSDEEGTLELALERLEEVEALEAKMGHLIECPNLNEQTWQNGYVHKIVFENYKVSFKRVGETFVIERIAQFTPDAYQIEREPYPVTEDYEKVQFYLENEECNKPILAEGEEVYRWNDIRFLSGTSGLVVVKDGLVVRSKTICMS